MNRLARCLGFIHRIALDWIGEEIAVGYGFVDTGKVLVDHPPGTQCHMTPSELPICPSGRPTAIPEVWIRVWGCYSTAIAMWGRWHF